MFRGVGLVGSCDVELSVWASRGSMTLGSRAVLPRSWREVPSIVENSKLRCPATKHPCKVRLQTACERKFKFLAMRLCRGLYWGV